MIRFDEYLKAKQLLREGYTQRAAAAIVGISRGSVAGIASGKINRTRFEKEEASEIEPPDGDAVRCPICGRMSIPPCLPCQVESVPRKNPRVIKECGVELGVNLKGDQKKRYENVKKWRESFENPNFYFLPDSHPLKREKRTKKR